MKACPLTFIHPSEAQQLDGIGPKICDHLAERLNTHCKTNGLPMPKKGKRKRRTGEEFPEGDLEEGMLVPSKKLRKKKLYVPTLRSGAYALMLALSSIPEDSLRSFSKAELVILAQPHCDSSFEVSSEGNKFYSAWNSMKTLTEKDLVQEKGRPTRKYYLSDEGWEIARKIRAVQAKNDKEGVAIGFTSNTKDKPTKQPLNRKPRFQPASSDFLDLDEDFEEETMVLMPYKPTRPSFLKRTDPSNKQIQPGGQRLGPKPADRYGTLSLPQEREAKSTIVDLRSSPEPELPRALPKVPSATELEYKPALEQTSAKPPPEMPSTTRSSPINHSSDTATVISSIIPGSLPNFLPSFNPIAIPPGTFTIQLVLDTREVRWKTDRDYIHDELVKKGVKPILRALELGDFFWVAKLKDPSMFVCHGEADEHSDELALDWIVERKRLDDLVGSITDGRFSEQKFRLKKSGVKNVIYLIEEFSLSNEKETRFHEAIQTAIASTQVVNGYFVKKTQKIDDTIRYIARLTRVLQNLYESKPLYLIPTRTIEGENYLPLLKHLRADPVHASRTYGLTYSTFASVSSKTDNLMLRDVFMKMLLCTKGISAEKALAVQKIWATPRTLIEALEACATERERDTLVADKMDAVVGRAKIKGVLGQKLAKIWSEE